jgi:hypothetical protein
MNNNGNILLHQINSDNSIFSFKEIIPPYKQFNKIQSLVKNKKDFILIGTIFLIIFGLSQFINRNQYSDESLKDFKEFASVGYHILDYNADKHILQNSEVMLRNDYSSNDINLIRNWFFVDSYLSDPLRLDALLDDTKWRGPISNFNSKESILSSINLLRNYPLNFILISEIILTFLFLIGSFRPISKRHILAGKEKM